MRIYASVEADKTEGEDTYVVSCTYPGQEQIITETRIWLPKGGLSPLDALSIGVERIRKQWKNKEN